MHAQTRREFLRSASGRAVSLGALAAVPGIASAGENGESKRPNVLFIICDQLNANALSCYGGPVATPNIDRIAAEGVRFDQATCPTPFCSPTRASIITGMYPHAHGITVNVDRLERPQRPSMEGIRVDDVTTEKLLNQAGWATNHYGKWHLWQDDLPYYADMFRPAQEYAKEMDAVFRRVRSGDRSGWMEWYNWALPVDVASEYREAVQSVPADRWSHKTYLDFIGKMGRSKLPLKQNLEVRVGDLGVERIKANADKPFMLTCSFNMPHDPNVVPSPYYEMFRPEQLKLPGNRNSREERFEKQLSRQIIANLGEVGLREFLRVYYAMVKLVDDQVGRLLAALDESGRTEDTIVVFTADHGDMMGGHGMVWKSTDAFYDDVARVPLLFRCPGRFKPAVSHVAADLVDMMPTLLELTGQAVPPQAQGQSLVPYLTGAKDSPQARPFSFSERVGRNKTGERTLPRGTAGNFMIRGQGWKYVRYDRGDECLYNLSDDPGETKNLAADPARRSVRDELAGEMRGWLERTGWPA